MQAQAQIWGYVYNPLCTPANGVQETSSTPLSGVQIEINLVPELRYACTGLPSCIPIRELKRCFICLLIRAGSKKVLLNEGFSCRVRETREKRKMAGKTASFKRLYVYIAAAITALGGFLFGYDTGVISGAILFIRKDFGLSDGQVEVVISSVLLGAVLGAACAGSLADRFGRRRLLLVTALFFTFAAFISAFAVSMWWFCLGRVLVGIAIGSASMISPLYIAEISPAHIRGRLVSLSQLAVTVGIVISYLVDYSLAPTGGWRWMVGIAAIPSVLLFLGMLFLPESPRWLIRKGFTERAMKILLSIGTHKEAHQELMEIKENLKIKTHSWKEAMTPWLKRTLLIGVGLAVFQQITGINTVIYYAPIIFEFAGFKTASAAILATVGVGVVNVLATLIALWLLDKVGRRVLLLVGLVGMIISLGLLSISFGLFPNSSTIGGVTVLSLMLYVASFAISLGPIFWLLIAEIYPLKIRGKAMSVATIANWGANMLVAFTFLTLIQYLGKGATFALYGAIGIGAWLFSYFIVPETKKFTLEQIEKQWKKLKR